MKKIICMLFFCFFLCGSFADGLSTGKTVELSIPFTIFTGVLSDNDDISDSDKGKMLDKYVEISGPYGVKPLSVQDIIDVCNAGGIINVDDCYTKIVNPVITKMRSIRFANVCNGNKTGGNQYCIDDVFAKGYVILGREEKSGAGYNPRTDDLAGGDRYYTYQSVVRPSSNEFAQDVEVSEYPAFGFAWEYAKKNGHDVVCSPEVNDNFINCATRDNTHFYTFKFADTHNTKDSVITKNLTKGLCALMDSEFIDKGFDSITSDGAMGLDININSDYGCVMSDCYDLNQIAVKFGLSTERKTVKVNGKSENICAIHGLELVGANVVNTYPGYEYMSYAFREIQTVMEPSLINILNAYIKAQGIDVTSFTCDYNPIKWRDESKIAGTSVSVSDDNLLRCQLNGKSVDFVFDDLFESKMSARIIGDTGMKCLLVNREKGGTASFDGKYCKGPNESQCVELGKKISGGTRWDAGAGACLLKDAAAVKTLNTTLTIAGGAAFTIGVTVLSGGTMAMVLLEVGGSVLLDLSFEGINRFYETRPNKLATEYVQSLQKCGLVGGDDARMCMNKQCIKDVVGKYIASIDGIIGDGVDALNDDQLQVFESVNERVNNCLTDLEIQSAVKNSAVTGKDKFVSHASMTLIIGGLFISPSNAVKKLSYLPKTSRILQRAGIKPIERVSSMLGNARYHRIYVQDLNMNDIRKMADELKTKGFYVSSNMDDTGKQFIGFADSDIFGPWHNAKNNWFFGGSFANDLRVKASQNFDKYLDDFLRTGQSNGLPVDRLTTDEWRRLNQELSGQGVELYQDVMNGKQVMRFRRIVASGINLRTKASSNFDKYLSAALDSNPTFYSLPKGRLSDIEWQQLNNELKSQGIQLVETYRGDELYMTFKRIDSGGNNSWIFSKVYNDMPDEMLNEKLKYIYEHSASTDEAVKALNAVGAFDERVAQEIAQDIADETVRRIQNVGGQQLISRMKNWNFLSTSERETLVYNLHELVTTQRRNHAGNTIVEVFDEPGSGVYGSHLAPGIGWTRKFRYNVSRGSVQDLLSTIIHENTHALQSIDKSSIHPAFVSWAQKHYVQPNVNYELYYNNVVEIEARYVGNNAAARVVKALGL